MDTQECFKTISYRGPVEVSEIDDRVNVNSLKVKNRTKHKDLKVNTRCLMKVILIQFQQVKLPLVSGDEICIDSFVDESTSKNCIDKDIIDLITNYKIKVIDKVKLRVKSSGLVHKVMGGKSEFYVNDEKVKNISVGRGLNVLVIDNKTLEKQFRTFDTHSSYDNTKSFIQFINQIPEDHYVAVSVFDEAIHNAVQDVSVYDGLWSQGWAKHYPSRWF